MHGYFPPDGVDVETRLAMVPNLDAAKFFASNADGTSWRGPCPFCPGSTRTLLIWVDHDWPMWNWKCDRCLRGGSSVSALDRRVDSKSYAPDPQKIEEARKRNAERDQIRQENRARKLAMLSNPNNPYWLAYHTEMTEANRSWWRRAGVPDSWQYYWKFGYTPRRPFMVKGHAGTEDRLEERPAYTMPHFPFGGVPGSPLAPVNIDYRLIFSDDDPKSWGKYRVEQYLDPAPWIARYDWEERHPGGVVLVTEGVKKGAVGHLEGTQEQLQVYALSGVNVWAGLDVMLREAQDVRQVYVIFDPDRLNIAWEFCLAVGEKARRVKLSAKLDDWFLDNGGTHDKFWRAMQTNSECPAIMAGKGR